MKTLKQAKVGETVKVVKLTGQGAVKRRIIEWNESASERQGIPGL